MKLAKEDRAKIAQSERELFKLEHKLEHMMEMAPGKILSQKDIELLNTKYLPIAKEIFQVAKAWSIHPERPAEMKKVNVDNKINPQGLTYKPAFMPGFAAAAAVQRKARLNHHNPKPELWIKPKLKPACAV
jgi:hypothetical protein